MPIIVYPHVFDKKGVFIHCFGCYGTTDRQFSSPCGIAVSPNGHVYVSDFHNQRIQIFPVLIVDVVSNNFE